MKDYFTDAEFACKCDRGDKCAARDKRIDPVLRLKLNGVRLKIGESVEITSGIRCPYWNKKVGGTSGSMHLDCKAVDVKSKGGIYMRKFVKAALEAGLTIGVMKKAIHVDVRPGAEIMFGYDD